MNESGIICVRFVVLAIGMIVKIKGKLRTTIASCVDMTVY